MKKLTKTQMNDKFLSNMRSRGFDTVIITELPFPSVISRCHLVLAKRHNLVYIRDEVTI